MPSLCVLGGGAAALWLTREARAANFDVTLVSERPLANYASTRNQGWLQSGALYAGLGQTRVAIDCQLGSRDLQRYAPECVRSTTPCYFFFGNRDELMQYYSSCRSLGIGAHRVSARSVAQRYPLADSAYLQHVLCVADRPMNARRILEKVAAEATELGVVRYHADLDDVHVDRRSASHGLEVRENSNRIGAFDYVVLAGGPLLPDMLRRLPAIPHPQPKFTLTKIEVVAITGIGSDELPMLVAPEKRGGPNIVPFQFYDENGFTICLTKADDTIHNPADTVPRAKVVSATLNCIKNHFPTLAQRIIRAPAHAHICQKIHLDNQMHDRSRILFDLGTNDRDLDGIFALYAGKFTAARLAAKECLGEILSANHGHVAEQPYSQAIPYSERIVLDANGELQMR